MPIQGTASRLGRATISGHILVLGGTQFIGRVFCQRALNCGSLQLTLLNRGQSNPQLFESVERLRCDRNDLEACAAALDGRHFNYVVDFSGWQHAHIENIVSNCKFDHYTFFSSSAVELAWPEDEHFSMAQHKLWCEHLIQGASASVLIVRPGFVVGQYDKTNRFEQRGPHWYWRGTNDAVRPLIQVEFLANVLLQLIRRKQTGIFRAGYSRPRVSQLGLSN